MNDNLQNADEQMGGTICALCEGEGEYLVHLALDSAENIYETCPICKGKGVRTMNDLQNALERLKLGVKKRYGTTILLPGEAQALLDERDALREAFSLLTIVLAVWKLDPYKSPHTIAAVVKQARAIIAKARNEEA